MIDIGQLRVYVVRPVLTYLNMWSDVAENLVIGTAIQESHATYLKQVGGGPAVGIFQMEPFTHDDTWSNYINYHPDLARLLHGLTMSISSIHPNTINSISANEMIGNLYYATAMCRVRYMRVPAALPNNDVNGLAAYWKQWYNTPNGAGTIQEFVNNYNTYNKTA